MKLGFYTASVLLLTLSIYVLLKGFGVSATQFIPQNSRSSGRDTTHVTERIIRKGNCVCCAKKISPAEEKAKQRQQAREA